MKRNTSVTILYFGIVVYLILLLILSGVYSHYLLSKAGMYQREICFSLTCIELFISSLESLDAFINGALKLLLSLVSVFGIYNALKSYINSIQTSRSNIYLTHLNTFKQYLMHEIESFDSLNIKSFNILKWYNMAFPLSRSGDLDVGVEYKEFIKELNDVIKNSNEIASGRTPAEFKYRQHQSDMIDVFKRFGIKMLRLPRNDFYEVEGDLMNLIIKVNSEFCFMGEQGELHERVYN